MLIRATFENLFSFNSPQTISFVAGRTKTLPNHVVASSNRRDPNILKAAIVYGANASGKSNLVKCFDFARRLILRGTRADDIIPRRPFKLEKTAGRRPSSFEFEISVDRKIYAYKAVFDEREVIEERLTLIGKTAEKELFHRTTQNGKVKIAEGNFLKKAEEKKFFQFIAQGTRPNQLFLRETIDRNAAWFRPVYDWFKDRLVIIYPDSKSDSIEFLVRSNERLKDNYTKFFENFDLGIDGIEVAEIDFNTELENIPKVIRDDIAKTLLPGKSMTLLNAFGQNYRFVREDDGTLKAFRMLVRHLSPDGSEPVLFDLMEESDGTNRLIDLIPALVAMADSENLFLIDEIDRSMHSQLSRAFFEFFFTHSKKTSQVLATTHELDLLDLELFRKDEIWFVEKDRSSMSHLYSLEEFKPRYDKEIRRGYLQGRFGAIPIVKNMGSDEWVL